MLARCFIIIFILSAPPDKKSFNTLGYNFSQIRIKTPILSEISELCHLSSRQSVASMRTLETLLMVGLKFLVSRKNPTSTRQARHSPNSALKYLCVFALQYELWNQ